MGEQKGSHKKLVYETQASLYAKAIRKMEMDKLIVQFAYKVENYLTAAEMFDEVGDYQDAEKMAVQCRELAEMARKEEKEYCYNMAMDLEKKARNIKGYEKAEKMLKEISGYRDADEHWSYCVEKRQNLERKKKLKKGVRWCSLLAMAAAVIVFMMSPQWNQLKACLMGETIEKTEETELPGDPILTAQVGDQLTFGQHVWYVLNRDDTMVKLILFQAEKFEELRNTPYHEVRETVTWENCSMRNWLNGEFLEEHFSDAEQERILSVNVVNKDNTVYETEGGNNTRDKVFLLSTEEVMQYKEILSHIRMNIWLRTPGNSDDTASFMASNTAVMDYGYPVDCRNIYTCPVICVSLE